MNANKWFYSHCIYGHFFLPTDVIKMYNMFKKKNKKQQHNDSKKLKYLHWYYCWAHIHSHWSLLPFVKACIWKRARRTILIFKLGRKEVEVHDKGNGDIGISKCFTASTVVFHGTPPTKALNYWKVLHSFSWTWTQLAQD